MPGVGVTCVADPFAVLFQEFVRLQHYLAPVREGAVGGLTTLRSRLNHLQVAALAADDAGAYVAVNEAAAQLTGFHVHALQRMSVWDLTPPPDERTGDRLWAAFLDMREQHGVYTLQA